MRYIGKVFLLRMNVNHVGSILDAPVSRHLSMMTCVDSFDAQEIFWVRDT